MASSRQLRRCRPHPCRIQFRKTIEREFDLAREGAERGGTDKVRDMTTEAKLAVTALMPPSSLSVAMLLPMRSGGGRT
jgi:hypothetical protein